jgi:hypothetical protein
MSAVQPQRLQRAVVCLLHDPALVAALGRGEAVLGLSERELGWLRAVDPRAWGADPFRAARALTGLIDEYPLSVARLAVAGAQAWFSSADFHAAVLGRRSLSLSFGAWVAARVPGWGPLELAIATSRRPRPEGAGLVLAPGYAAVEVPDGCILHWSRARSRLMPDPAAAIAEGRSIPAAPSGRKREWVLIEPGPQGPQMGECNQAMFRLLSACSTPVTRPRLAELGRSLGADEAELTELLGQLLGEGLLVER